ncbi:hypothetical protein [Leucobacter sp. wl10]|uniref:hypothetical protein n=1 Tax=Leucobacter sp. wl10 TaxID=2304677 RepID=UPI000E5B2681|nr:hypothetical protein [Leucobacter sp. wl10]RGE19073.1 hypothetical protein D1J51_13200 [Leucobacter sp. wl10]
MSNRTSLAEAIDGSHDVQYAPWVWGIECLGRGALRVRHCTPDCDDPAGVCPCYRAKHATILTATRLRAVFTQARGTRALCCPDPDNFCAEDADQILQRALYGELVFG